MPFINEKLTPEQQEIFNSWGIKYPLYLFGKPVKEVNLDDPDYWTVDKERNIHLLIACSNRYFQGEMLFVFIWNNRNFIVQFNQSFEGNDVVWNIPQNYLSENIFPYCTEEHFIDDLRDALIVYGAFGDPDSKFRGSTKCNF